MRTGSLTLEYETCFRQNPDHCYILDGDGTIVDLSDRAIADLGAVRSQFIGKPFHPAVHPASARTLHQLLEAMAADQESHDVELKLSGPASRILTLLIAGTRIVGNSSGHYLITGKDITARLAQEEALNHLARRDALTGAYNRHYMNELLTAEVGRSRRYGHTIAFLMVDIDRFKEINDAYGHLFADGLLRDVSETLMSAVREQDAVIRYGGDEFLVIMPETNGQIGSVTKRIRRTLAEWSERHKRSGLTASCSVGGTYCIPRSKEAVERAIRRADARMYQAKQRRCVEQ